MTSMALIASLAKKRKRPDEDNLSDAEEEEDSLSKIKEKATKIRPNTPSYDEISVAFGGRLGEIINTPQTHPEEWEKRKVVEFEDNCIRGKASITKSYTLYVHKIKQSCTGLHRKLVEISDTPGFFFPELEQYGYVDHKDRKRGKLYRIYVGKNGHSKCAEKVRTNRFGKHSIAEKTEKNKTPRGITNPQCSLCLVATKSLEANTAIKPLFCCKDVVCTPCQTMVGEEKTLQNPCHGENCKKEANYNELKDGAGKNNFFCAGCYTRKHGEKPKPKKLGKCDCELGRRFNQCAICCIISNRPVWERTCIRVKEEGSSMPCNTIMSLDQVRKSRQEFPDLHPLCPRCFEEVMGEKKKRELRENEWRKETRAILQDEMGENFVPFEHEVTLGSGNDCLSKSLENEASSRRADFMLSVLDATFVFELDQYGHSEKSYKCSHNSDWNQLVFDALRSIRGNQYDVYIIRINPDGKEDGKRISLADDRGVGLSARTAANAAKMLISHARERNQLRQSTGDRINGKCFLTHYFYSQQSIQFANEKNLCETRADEFEMIR